MSKKQKKIIKIVAIFYILSVLVLSIYMYDNKNNTIIIGTKNLTEQRVISFALSEVIKRDLGYNVKVLNGMDATTFLHSAIIDGDIDMYIEYSSSAFFEVFKQEYKNQTNEEIVKYIKKEYNDVYDLSWIPLGFDNSNAIVCTDFCKENNINTYSDLTKYEDISFAAPVYFYERSDGFPLLEKIYRFSENIDKIKMDTVLIYSAIDSNDVDFGLGFTTDSKLASGKYKILEDDKGAFPKYSAGLLVRNESLEKFEGLEEELKKFENIFTNEDIQKANKEVEDGQNIKDVSHRLVIDKEI